MIPLEGVMTGDELTRETWDAIATGPAPRLAPAASGFGITLGEYVFHRRQHVFGIDNSIGRLPRF